MDPIVIERSLAFLDVAAGGGNASVSKAWRSVCGSWALWHDLSQPLRKWRNIAVDARLHPREFCRLSIADSKRTSLTRDELCSQTWRFRFKRAAGEEWLAVVRLLRPTPTPPTRRAPTRAGPLLDGQQPRDHHLHGRRHDRTGRHLGARGRSQVALGPLPQGAPVSWCRRRRERFIRKSRRRRARRPNLCGNQNFTARSC